jgi:hypothetical protein
MKLTASTITTASISTLTNSLTELATALGWSCTCTSATPAAALLDALRRPLQRLAQRE